MQSDPRRSGNASAKPRIAYVMSRFPKLTETFILYEILALEGRGIPVAIYPLLRENADVRHPDVDRVMPRVRYHPFVSGPILAANLHFLLRSPGRYLGALAEVLWGTRTSRNFFVGALGIFPKAVRFAWEMREAGIEHLHAHFCTHPALAALIVHRLVGIPFSFTAHGSDLHVDRTMLDRKVAASAFAVTVSRFNAQVIVNECGEEARGKIRVVHCGVDPEVFVPRDSVGTPDGPSGGAPGATGPDSPSRPLRVILVGSFEEVKGHRYLLEACSLLRERGVAVECDFVGDGPVRADVERQIAESGLSAAVRVHGGIPREEVLRLLGEADVIALPSVPTAEGKREGIPVALMEGMAMGLPVVSSRLSGIPELVEDGVSGFLAEPCDSAGIAQALEALAADGSLRVRMGAAGREMVLREFDLRANARRLTELFGLGGQGEPAPREVAASRS